MTWLKKTLVNPFLLAAQGFLVGASLFVATHPEMMEPETGERPSASAPASR